MVNMTRLNLGKNGLTPGFLENLKKNFLKVEHVRISLLKSSTRDKEEVKKWTDEILKSLGVNYTAKVIGYTIILRKWRKSKDKTKSR